MKLLTATSLTQGDLPGDFCFATQGELVWLGEVCARDRADLDGGCGCGRAFAGLTSRRATTTAVVAELDLSYDDLRAQVAEGFERSGFTPAVLDPLDFTELAEETADEMLHIARIWPVGTVVGRRLDNVHRRRPLPPGMTLEEMLRRLSPLP
ncbi:hypothetical protein [Blastococcus sp. TF02A-26]|uniref:DUF7715 family protein n=1 Tax=Blastococcus sp. TF02A-26 TaxID=2250577 RepID=UPI0018F63335|nr:hypothetical protein [Blastococcus sp. TF02A-26]